ncbi:hypothetical protein [Bacillus toyonensis]|uniref:hypothetical protein n=1 Tax=Bacillus toyonensis TaxID=155322 RepID=UPI00254073B7|nr:hypothetical protein [Bacillus toyonensis]WIG29977.1 hypothetical protein QPL81_15120 [Bacillus toyonensis]
MNIQNNDKPNQKMDMWINEQGQVVMDPKFFADITGGKDSGMHFTGYCCSIYDRGELAKQETIEAESRADATLKCKEYFNQINPILEIGDGMQVSGSECGIE